MENISQISVHPSVSSIKYITNISWIVICLEWQICVKLQMRLRVLNDKKVVQLSHITNTSKTGFACTTCSRIYRFWHMKRRARSGIFISMYFCYLFVLRAQKGWKIRVILNQFWVFITIIHSDTLMILRLSLIQIYLLFVIQDEFVIHDDFWFNMHLLSKTSSRREVSKKIVLRT